jgi:LysM repeat protein
MAVLAAVTLLPAGAAGAGVVHVPPGATLDGLAASLGVTAQELATLNHLTDPNHILAGSTLLVPGTSPGAGAAAAGATPGEILVAPGETLWSLSQQWGTTVDALAEANGIADPNLVLAGTELRVPGPGAAAAGAPTPAVSTAPGRFPPRLVAHADRVALAPVLAHWATAFGVPVPLFDAMCWWESGWQPSIVSSTGAIGIGQLEPATVAIMRLRLADPGLDPWVAGENAEMAAGFLSGLLRQSGDSSALALAYYYQGAKSVNRIGMLPFTRVYVEGILATAAAYSW